MLPVLAFSAFVLLRFSQSEFEAAEQQLRERIGNVLSGLRPDGFSASVIALADATKILQKSFGPVPKERVKDITDGDWASKAVKDAVSAAITAATTVTTLTAVSSAGSN